MQRSQPRSARRHSRACRSCFRYRGGGGISLPLQRRRRPPAPLGAWRLAVAAVDIRLRCQMAPQRKNLSAADGALEAAGQSAPLALCARGGAHHAAGLASAIAGGGFVDRLRRPDRRAAVFRSPAQQHSATAPPHLVAQSHPRAGPRFRTRIAAKRVPAHLPRPSGLADDGCGGPHTLSPCRAPPPARMGYRGTDQ